MLAGPESARTTYIVRVFDKPHWRTILTTGSKAEAEALENRDWNPTFHR